MKRYEMYGLWFMFITCLILGLSGCIRSSEKATSSSTEKSEDVSIPSSKEAAPTVMPSAVQEVEQSNAVNSGMPEEEMEKMSEDSDASQDVSEEAVLPVKELKTQSSDSPEELIDEPTDGIEVLPEETEPADEESSDPN
ncbi:hypothetical protein WDW89_24665 [Deltaproteobacteria bacterium TL4]